MTSFDKIAQPIGEAFDAFTARRAMGYGSWLALSFLFAISCNAVSRDRSRYVLSCRLRWSHVTTYEDSLKTAQRCGNEGRSK